MSNSWSWYITIISLANILACIWLIRWTAKKRPNEAAAGDSTGHEWDGLTELNNPMPRWWLWLFYLTIVFSLIYLVLYPGLGNFKGTLGWSQNSAWEQEVAATEERVAPLFAEYATIPIPSLALNEEAMQTGRRLFSNNCAVCHGADGGGRSGFPDLTDDTWQWGGDPAQIHRTILSGRSATMPAMGAALGETGVNEVAAYVLSLSGGDQPEELVERGQARFGMMCAACHAADGTGNPAMGAPNLADDDWLYGDSIDVIRTTIRDGRQGKMPAQKDLLGEDRVHLLAAYIYSLSEDAREQAASESDDEVASND